MLQRVEICYLGRPATLDPETGEAKIYVADYTFKLGEDWKLRMVRELKAILNKYEGIKEIRSYVP